MEVLPYFGNRYTTFVRKYESIHTFESTKVLSYEVRKYESTKVLSYESTFESTKVRKYYVVLSYIL